MRYLLLVSLVLAAVEGRPDPLGRRGKSKSRSSGVVIEGEDVPVEESLSEMGGLGMDLYSTRRDGGFDNATPDTFEINSSLLKDIPNIDSTALGMMKKYGFLEVAMELTEEELDNSDNLVDESAVTAAIRLFQERYNLPVDGTLNRETVTLMQKDRCGVKDVEYTGERAKRYATSKNKWEKTRLNYWYNPEKMTSDLPLETIKRETEEAFQLWADHAGITFVEVADEQYADITMSFEYGDHGDSWPFSGPGGVLAHAAYPLRGWLHFDDAEDFTSGTFDGTQYKQVALHELGHNLGIKHSDVRNAIMFPYYYGYTANLVLDEDDILAVQDRLGAGSGTVIPLSDQVEPTEGPTPTADAENPPRCIQKIDAAFRWDNNPGYIYVFAGAWYYRLMPTDWENNNKLPLYDSEAGAKRIGIDGFAGIPRNLDAAVESLNDPNQFYAFKDNNYYLFDLGSKRVVKNGTLSDLWRDDPPEKIDGALRVNSYTLGFLSGDKLYKYRSDKNKWAVGKDNSNYFSSFEYDSLALGYYNRWTWVFQGSWYTVARNTDAKVSSAFTYRPIENDIGLIMCSEGVGELSTEQKNQCKKELKKYKKKPGYLPSSQCTDYILSKYSASIDTYPS